MANQSQDPVKVIEARKFDIDSLTTIVPRSFHPVNPYIKQALPDTPLVRKWWAQVFEYERNEPNCHVLVALDPATDKDIGILLLRLMGAHEEGAGVWTNYELSEDHDEVMYSSMVNSMVEHRERTMLGRPHYLIELFGVDHAWKGRSVGTKLLARACEIADRDGYDVFVQSNASAKAFYARLGFNAEGEVMMPGEHQYREYMLVRRKSKE